MTKVAYGDSFIAPVLDSGIVHAAEDPGEMDRSGHFQGCLVSGCEATRCAHARAMVPRDRYVGKSWLWRWTRGDV